MAKKKVKKTKKVEKYASIAEVQEKELVKSAIELISEEEKVTVTTRDATAIEKCVILDMWCKTLQASIEKLEQRIDRIVTAIGKAKSVKGL